MVRPQAPRESMAEEPINDTGFDGDLDIGPLDELPPYVPLREAVYLALKRAILEGTLNPGQQISENKIANKLSVSRTPVREAIRILERDNLVSLQPGRKVIVSVPSPREIEEVYEIRAIVEAEALRRIGPEDEDLIRTLEQCVEEAEILRTQGNLREMGEVNNRFHLTIISALKNGRLDRFMDSLNDTISRFRYYSLASGGPSEFGEEHRRIVSCLKAGDTDQAVSLLLRHLTKPKRQLTEQFSKSDVASPND